MLRSPWSRLAKSGFRSLVLRIAQRVASRPRFRRLRPRLRSLCFHQPAYVVSVEALEDRLLLFASAVNDSYSVVHDHTITPNAASGAIANDFGFGTITATL